MRRPRSLRAQLTYFFAGSVLGTTLLYGVLVTVVLATSEYFQHAENPSLWLHEGIFDEALQALGAIVFSMPIAVVGSIVMGGALARKALAPLREARDRVRAARASELDLCLPDRGTGDEWDTLAGTLNELLSDARASLVRIRSFTSDAAHELRTPLTIIMGETEVSLRRERTPEEYRRTLAIVLDETRQLSLLVDALLQLARADAGTQVITLEPVELHALARQSLQRTEQLLAAQSRSLTLELTGDPTQVRGNPVLLSHVLDNLLSNACRYARERIRLELEATDTGVRVTVGDDGKGVDAGFEARLFQRFARADASRQGEGTGLGLAVSRTIAEAHGGTLDYSRVDGESRFILRLPKPEVSDGPPLPAEHASADMSTA
ncbi:HAMP domain-containing protein [Corallococcus exiguus]|uniref:sensor histidine kinase n=1 Tax=Corallococcus TaxID=83461 RepID=UPI000EA1B346|nr:MULTISPECIES: ATP-binding protein [Corallococcus]NNC16931.1 HAMP domain-containing protein [Corallococcus exiguus]NRD61983.1 HAMP domain-containing protein [Corallococcus exiguus]RKH30151.1 HAMP domain-containing protein [Corallococcus sp. CA041A]RKI19296.1 HAMP domain-containing protein [Corallococcus sp. AB030]RUO90865.1 HAMP domain-containing protein [Corallococcus sp. AB018]